MERKLRLAGRMAIVTGAAGGIGSATARRLAAEGCSLELWDIRGDALEDLSAELRARYPGLSIHGRVVDLRGDAAIASAVSAATSESGPTDILINNAGHLGPGRLLDQPMDTWRTTIDINVNAVVSLTYAVLPDLIARKTGHVVNISSAGGFVGVSGLAVYSASKWAVYGLTEALRHEIRDVGAPGIRFSSVHPMYIASGMFAGSRIRGLGGLIFPRLKNHDVVAKAIVESALIRRRRVVRRPRSLVLVPLLRGLLSDSWFNGMARVLGVNHSMDSWEGPAGFAESVDAAAEA